jgi:hypothetical protein
MEENRPIVGTELKVLVGERKLGYSFVSELNNK